MYCAAGGQARSRRATSRETCPVLLRPLCGARARAMSKVCKGVARSRSYTPEATTLEQLANTLTIENKGPSAAPFKEVQDWLNAQEKVIGDDEASMGSEQREIVKDALVKVIDTGSHFDGEICRVTGRDRKTAWIGTNGKVYRLSLDNLALFMTPDEAEDAAILREMAETVAIENEAAEAATRAARAAEAASAAEAAAAAEKEAEEAVEKDAEAAVMALAGIVLTPPQSPQEVTGPVRKHCWVRIVNAYGFADTPAYVTGISKKWVWVRYEDKLYKVKHEMVVLYAVPAAPAEAPSVAVVTKSDSKSGGMVAKVSRRSLSFSRRSSRSSKSGAPAEAAAVTSAA